jgi:hypothetical protein
MKSSTILRERLLTVLFAAPFVLSTSCRKSESRETYVDTRATPSAPSAPAPAGDSSTTESAVSLADIASANPSSRPCIEGAFCARAARMKAFAARGANVELGCPTETVMPALGDPDADAGFGAPPMSRPRFNARETEKRRAADGGDDACCYTWMRGSCFGGRPLRVGDRIVTARGRRGGPWSVA